MFVAFACVLLGAFAITGAWRFETDRRAALRLSLKRRQPFAAAASRSNKFCDRACHGACWQGQPNSLAWAILMPLP